VRYTSAKMTTYELTNHPNFNIKHSKEFFNGVLVAEEFFDEEGISRAIKYDYENDIYEIIASYGEDRDGLKTLVYANDTIFFQGNYSNGKQDGVSKYYYENGNIHFFGEYKNDDIYGNYESYYENGNLALSGHSQNGKLNGPEIYYDEEGNEIKRILEPTVEPIIKPSLWSIIITKLKTMIK